MAKQSGLGDAFYVGGNDVSGDIQSLQKISGTVALLESTDITQSAHSRLPGHRDGAVDFTSYWDPTNAHPVLSALPTADVQVMYCRGTTLGNPAAGMVAKQLNYDGNRQADGSYMFTVNSVGNGFALEWGNLLTAGMRTDTAATNGTALDQLAATSFGAQAYLQVSAFTGTDVTVTIQDSADNSTFANVTGLSFTAVSSAPQAQRIFISNTATLRRYVRAVTTTVGGFTSASFAVMLVRNTIANVVF